MTPDGDNAHDVLHQMQAKGMLGYQGAPVFDDLEGGLTVANVMVVHNRVMVSARALFRAVHEQPAFAATGWQPTAVTHRLLRDGLSVSLNASEDDFQTRTLISRYVRAGDEERGGYLALFFDEAEPPKLQAGLWSSPNTSQVHWRYALSDMVEREDLERLSVPTGELPLSAVEYPSDLELAYDERPWEPGDGSGDVRWAVRTLASAAQALDALG